MSAPASGTTSAPQASEPLPGEVTVPAELIDDSQRRPGIERIADEVPVSLIYNGMPHAVMLASPVDLEDFALGFSLSEGIIEQPREFDLVDILKRDNGLLVHALIPAARHAALERRKRSLSGRSGCGLCGAESLDAAIRPIARVNDDRRYPRDEIHAALALLEQRQPLNRETGAVHAAGLCDEAGLLVREDIGRHNALDKLIGAMHRLQRGPGFAVMTSRASYEIVHKAASANIALVVAISAPTALAVRLAEASGITLAGFARAQRMTVYTHPSRIF